MEKLKNEYDIDIIWRAFPLRPDIPENGIGLNQIAAGLQIDPEVLVSKFKKMAADYNLPSCELERIYNSRSAQELGCWAKSLNKEGEYHVAAFRAFYAEGLDISNMKVLADIAESIGLAGKEAIMHLKKETFKAMVDSDWKLARDLELVAAPTYIINQNRLVGAHPYQRLKKFLESNGATRRV